MNTPCEHHKTCGDCFSPNKVRTLVCTIENLAQGLAEATEANLATIEELQFLKSSSQYRIRRQKGICLKMLAQCRSVVEHINWGHDMRQKYHRVKEILDSAGTEPDGLQIALDRWTTK